MAKLAVELVTAEGRVLSEEADFVRLPGLAGEFGVLPRHISLLTPLRTGEALVRNGDDEHILFVSGGFVEVLPDKVVILADVAERAEEIDTARAEAARKRAQELLSEDSDNAEASAMLERAMFRLRVAEVRHRRHRGSGAPPPS